MGTLYDQLTYPEQIGEGDTTLSKERLVEILSMVDLGYLAEREGALDTEINWEEEASLGEKQRLAIARLVYHKPRYAILDGAFLLFLSASFFLSLSTFFFTFFLWPVPAPPSTSTDKPCCRAECTSAVSSEMEREMYRICRQHRITYITISHRPALMAFHERILTIGDGKCGYTLSDIDHSKLSQKEMALATATTKAVVDTGAEAKIKQGLEARSAKYAHLDSSRPKELKDISTRKRFGRILKIAFRGSGKPKVALIAVMIVIEQFLRYWHQTLSGEMFVILMNQARGRVPGLMLQSTFVSLILAGCQLVTRFTSQRLELTMSEELTKSFLSRYISGGMFYKMASLDKRIKDPDQRIAEDIKSFCEATTGMFAEVISPLAQFFFFVGVVGRMLGKWAPIGMVGYFGGVTLLLQTVMPNYKQIVKESTELEGKFKYVHSRVKSCAESIAFFGGDSRELVIVDRRFKKLMDLLKRKIRIDLQFGMINTIVTEDGPGQIQWLLRMAFAVFQAGSDSAIIADKGASMNKNQLLLLTANDQVFSGLKKLFAYIEKFASLSGFIARLGELDEVLVDLAEADIADTGSGEYEAAEGNELSFSGVDIVTPTGSCLASGISLSVTSKNSLMVTGANAVGKTSFFRVLGGLWPVNGGKLACPAAPGTAAPGINEIFLVPQRIYMCIGSLADQVTYPHRIAAEDRTEAQTVRLQELLDLVGIGYLVERWEKESKEEGGSGWDTETKWEDVLSLGEQQRTGMARLFWHKPRFGVLDECTSAVSVDVEERLYRSAADMGITCITISQRLALTEFHAQELHLGAPNAQGWTLTKIDPVDAPSDPEDARDDLSEDSESGVLIGG